LISSTILARVHGAAETIEAEALSWDGVGKHPARFGGVQFRLGGMNYERATPR
jgi:hypothetical protein